MDYSFGLLQSPPDVRDYIYKDVLKPLTVSLPTECLDWLVWTTPVKFQEKLGACAAFTGAAAVELVNFKELNHTLDLSEQFLYGESKKIDGSPDEDGTYLRAILSALKHTGICEESYKPYEGKYPPKEKSTVSAYANALKYKIESYASVLTDINAMKTAIFQTGPVLVGIKVYESFETTTETGIVASPKGELKGYHALPILGYNTMGFIVKNSWSPYWGNKGYCTIPWKIWEEINMGEAWSITDAKNSNECSILNYVKCYFKSKIG